MAETDRAADRTADRGTEVRNFAYHLVTYLFMGALLAVLDVRGGTAPRAVVGLDWAFWPLLLWGFGLAGHAVHVFVGRRAG
jgi:hypothetical protein